MKKSRINFTPICHPRLLENLFIEGDEEAKLREYAIKEEDKGE